MAPNTQRGGVRTIGESLDELIDERARPQHLGSVVRDIITGVQGVAVARGEFQYGCNRIAIESTELKKDGKPSDSIWVDEQRVELVEAEKFTAVKPPACNIKLGSHVRDRHTGFEGLAVARNTWFGGELNICIEPTKLHEGKPIEGQWFSLHRVELVQEQAPPVSKHNMARSGGPQNDQPIR